jgi:hypothetical protein
VLSHGSLLPLALSCHRNQQAREPAAALAGSRDPVVLVGDLNFQPDDTAGAYGTFAAAGACGRLGGGARP